MKLIITVLSIIFLCSFSFAQDCEPAVSVSLEFLGADEEGCDILLTTNVTNVPDGTFVELIVLNTNCATSYDVPDFSEPLECTVDCAKDLELLVITYDNAFYPCHDTLIVIPSSALPVELTEFKGKLLRDNSVELKWTTASELNNEKFIVEHSTDGRNWIEIEEVQGGGTTETENHYSCVHSSPSVGSNYYRLNQVDYDGRHEYSPSIEVNMQDVKRAKVLGNPVSGNTLRFTYNEKEYSEDISFFPARPRIDIIKLIDGEPVLVTFSKIN